MDNKLFYMWLAGQVDGDGCFYLGPNGYCTASISTNTLDLPMFEYIKDNLGFGYIYPVPNENY